MQKYYPDYSRSNLGTGIFILCAIHLAYMIGVKIDTEDTVQQFFPIVLIVSLIVLLYYQKQWNIRSLLFMFVIFLGGFFIQALATETNEVFGNILYKNSLGPKLFNTPIVIGVNWLILIYSAGYITKDMKIGLLAKCSLSSLLLVLMDVLMEPVAMKYDFWDWRKPYHAIPLQNYFGWFIVSFFMFLYFFNLKAKLRNSIAPYLFVIQLLFYLFMNFI